MSNIHIKYLHMSTGRGPQECELFLTKLLNHFIDIFQTVEPENEVHMIDCKNGENSNTFKSVFLKLKGKRLNEIENEWSGTLKWICKSPYRPRHKRQNWFIALNFVEKKDLEMIHFDKKDLEICISKSSGPGGQNVNKRNTCVQIKHVSTGIIVKSQSQRSQSQNYQKALELLKLKLCFENENKKNQQEQSLWFLHNDLERGNPKKIFKGFNLEKI